MSVLAKVLKMTAFLSLIVHVVLVCTEKQMVRINAVHYVAMMKDK